MSLKKFDSSELFLTQQSAWIVLQYFFGGNSGLSPGELTDNDRSFAQALLIEAIDKSEDMSWIESIFSSAMSLDPSVKDILKDLAKHAVKTWFHKADPSDLASATIYQSVYNTLRRNWRSAWEIRVQTGMEAY